MDAKRRECVIDVLLRHDHKRIPDGRRHHRIDLTAEMSLEPVRRPSGDGADEIGLANVAPKEQAMGPQRRAGHGIRRDEIGEVVDGRYRPDGRVKPRQKGSAGPEHIDSVIFTEPTDSEFQPGRILEMLLAAPRIDPVRPAIGNRGDHDGLLAVDEESGIGQQGVETLAYFIGIAADAGQLQAQWGSVDTDPYAAASPFWQVFQAIDRVKVRNVNMAMPRKMRLSRMRVRLFERCPVRIFFHLSVLFSF